MALVIRRFADTRATPWRNGLGLTWSLVDDDLASELTPGQPWRLSVAHLAAPAPFSAFPGVHRTLVPWGGGIRLEIDGQAHDAAHGEPVRFPGAATTRLLALERPCHAVNLMASDTQATLLVAAAGTRFDDEAIALAIGATMRAARFDVVKVDPHEPLPFAAVVVRVGDH